MSAVPEGTTLYSEHELIEKMNAALSGGAPTIREIGDQLAQMALEAQQAHDHYLSRASRDVRWFYRIGSWSYSGLSAVVAAAVGGAVLAFNQLPAWARYSIAAASLVAAVVGALRPSDYLARDLNRKDLYQAFHRRAWQYILVELPQADERDGVARLHEFAHVLDQIRGIAPGYFDHPPSTGNPPLTPGAGVSVDRARS
jgi:hypothetical protein